MVASKESDIPEWKSKYCPCKGCGTAREEGRQEVRRSILIWSTENNIDITELFGE